MATRLTDEFPARTKAPTAAYPDGSYMNETAPGANDGTPLDERIGDDYEGLKQGLLNKAGITPNGQPDSVTNPQQIQAIEKFIGDGDSQLAGGAIWPLSGQDGAQIGDDLTSYEFVRLQGNDFANITKFDWIAKDGSGKPKGIISTIQLTAPYSITVNGVDSWLLISNDETISTCVTAKAFGVASDGSDSTEQLKAVNGYMSSYGRPVDMTGVNCQLSEQIGDDANGFNNNWVMIGDDCLITFVPPSSTKYVWANDIGANHNCFISSGVKIDVNNNAYSGIAVLNNQAANSPTVNSKSTVNATVINTRRSGTDFGGGDAVIVQGSFTKSIFGGVIDGVALANGAGIPLVQGVAGYSTAAYSTACFVELSIVSSNAEIRNVYSEDTSYTQDQDGYRALGPQVGENLSECIVKKGAIIELCAGRNVKSQVDFARISGTHRVNRGNSGAINSLIDLQYGGICHDLEIEIDGIVPGVIFGHGGYAASTDQASSGTFRDVQITSNVTLPVVYQTFPRENFSGDANIYNVNVRGEVDTFAELLVNDSERFDTVKDVKIDKLNTSLVTVLASGSTSPYFDTVNIENCVNKDATTTPLLVRHRVSGSAAQAIVTEANNKGFPQQNKEVVVPFSGENLNPGFAPSKVVADGRGETIPLGVYVGESFQLDNNATIAVSQRGRTGQPNGVYVLVQSNQGNARAALFACDTSGTTDLTGGAIGSQVSFGANSNPGTSPAINLWISSGVLQVQNTTGSTINITIHSLT